MKLSYRGTSYQPEMPSVEMSESQTIGLYRGTPIKVGALAHSDRSSSNMALHYRGVSYIRSV